MTRPARGSIGTKRNMAWKADPKVREWVDAQNLRHEQAYLIGEPKLPRLSKEARLLARAANKRPPP